MKFKIEDFANSHRSKRVPPEGLRKSQWVKQSEPRMDHTGKSFPSTRAMCAAWGISSGAYYQRVSHGWSREQALTTPAGGSPDRVYDHTGRGFRSTRAMCEAWGVCLSTYRSRIDFGYTVEQALTTPPHGGRKGAEDEPA